ncbi:MAG: serine/threonine protein kinase [Thermoleophilia bacterium]|nr:serine/threonine protein kinase [Thermoleophilia bacterium]
MRTGVPTTELALGRYRLGTLLGRGATSSVRRAVDVRTGGEVAVKTIIDDADLVARAGREIRAASRLSHPHVVRLLDWGTDPDCVRLVWELIDGPSLRALVDEDGVDDCRAVEIMADVLDALDHAHARGVLHRDVKPANILIDPHGDALLGDFGVARSTGDPSLTRTGDVVGTVAYMAPEQARDGHTEPASDVYAASLVLYEMLTGHNPHRGLPPMDALRHAVSGVVPPIARQRPDLPPDVCRLVTAGLELNPADRPSAARMAGALRAAASRAWPGGPGVADAVRRHRWLAPLGRGAAAAVPAALALTEWTSLGPAATAGVAVAAGMGIAASPGITMLLGVVGALVLVGQASTGLAVALAPLAVALLLTGPRAPGLAMAAAWWPIAFAVGMGPLAAAVTGVAPRPFRRAQLAVAGVLGTLLWQLLDQGHGLLLSAGTAVPGGHVADGRGNPVGVVRDVAAPLAGAPWVWAQAAVLVAGAMLAGAMVRRRGGARGAAALAWITALVAGLAITGPDPKSALVACAASGVVVLGWALRPWRFLVREASPGPSATLPKAL